MFKLLIVIVTMAGQPLTIAPYPITNGTPDAEFADQATCEKAMPQALQETQLTLDANTHGELTIGAAKCVSEADIDKSKPSI